MTAFSSSEACLEAADELLELHDNRARYESIFDLKPCCPLVVLRLTVLRGLIGKNEGLECSNRRTRRANFS
jgi:hypothetical protein